MNKKGLWFLGLSAVVITTIIIFILQHRAAEMVQSDVGDIAVLNIKRVDVSEPIDSYLAWIPGKQNYIAAISKGFSKGDKIYSYDLETSSTKELYDLGEYGLDQRDTIRFFWSADGKRIVLGSGGFLNVKTKDGFMINLPDGYNYLDVYVISPNEKKIFVAGGGDNISGSFIIDNGEYIPFQATIDAFTPPLQPAPWKTVFFPLAWSQDESWFAIETYDPDIPPKSFSDVVPSAIYLMSIDGRKTHLISRNIEGRVTAITFSPDGDKIIWAVAGYNGDQFIFIANIDGSGAHEIFSNANLPSEYNIPTTSNLLWSLDGNRIVFAGTPDKHFNYHFWVLTLGKASPTTSNP